jgi:hypothetical protein
MTSLFDTFPCKKGACHTLALFGIVSRDCKGLLSLKEFAAERWRVY